MKDARRYGELLEDGSLRFVRDLPGPIERVWAYLTEPDRRARWLAGGTTGEQPGAPVEFQFDNASLTPHDDPYPEKYRELEGGVSFTGAIIACEPPRLLHFSWPENDGRLTEVIIRLSPRGKRVRLELEHRRIRTRDDLVGACAGWHVHLDILECCLKHTTPGPFWAAHGRLEIEYRELLAEALRVMSPDP